MFPGLRAIILHKDREDWIACLWSMQIHSTGNSNDVRNGILGVRLGAQNYHFCIHICAYVCLWLTFIFNNSFNSIRLQLFNIIDWFSVSVWILLLLQKLNVSYTVFWDSTYPHNTLSSSIFFLSSHPGWQQEEAFPETEWNHSWIIPSFFFFLTSCETFSCWPTLCCIYCTKYSIEKQ